MRRLVVVVPAGLVGWGLGCSEVQIDPQGGGGQTGSDTSATSASAGTPKASSSSGLMTTKASSSTGTDPELVAFCEAAGICMPTCAGAFQAFQLAPCEAQGHAFATCFAQSYDASTCSLTGCDAELEALLACRQDSPVECFAGSGTADRTECTFDGQCDLGTVGVICTWTPDGADAACSCFLNALHVGTCTGPLPTPAWDVCSTDTGCCGPYMGALFLPQP
jgi:hypothetical protein